MDRLQFFLVLFLGLFGFTLPAVPPGLVTDSLKNFLELNLPKAKAGKKPKYQLGIAESKLGATISDELSIPCTTGETERGEDMRI